uniref:4-hydroxy-4-methyl-2-oxoglutarate aldolase n=1 Tax=Pyrodinium bahamense TaxID=73915 RepID=A0A7S0F9X4_9DINO
MFGELLASEAARRGIAGMVVDGNCRDTPLLLQMSLPVYCRGRHPNAGTATKRGMSQVEISMGSVLVRPGDFVLGDDDGVVVCSEEELRQWLPKAESIQLVEARMLSHVQAGGSLFEKIPNFEAHLAAVAQGKASKLRFE